MTNQELADIIKKLPGLKTWEREGIEDEIGPLGPSGLISYATDPIKEAIEFYQDILGQWGVVKKNRRYYKFTTFEIDHGIWNSKDMIAKLS